MKLATAGCGMRTALASLTPSSVKKGTPLLLLTHEKKAASSSRATTLDGVEGKKEKKRSAWTKRSVSHFTVSGGGIGEPGVDEAAQRVAMEASSIS
jgi:hypothetical protein